MDEEEEAEKCTSRRWCGGRVRKAEEKRANEEKREILLHAVKRDGWEKKDMRSNSLMQCYVTYWYDIYIYIIEININHVERNQFSM